MPPRENANKSVDLGSLPNIRRGNIEILKTEISNKNLNVTQDDVYEYKRASRKERDEMLSDYYESKKRT